jgi:hypothetical protein
MLIVFAAPGAFAQTFQYTFGGDWTEAARGGVKPIREGGYIAVGESNSPSQGGTTDIYLVRTNGDGSLAWSATYDIGGNDSATDIEEVFFDPSGNRGYIITGVTQNLAPQGCGTNRDVFLIRIDQCGNVIWANTYGTAKTEEIGWDVVEMQFADNCKGVQGDFVVAGSTAAIGHPASAYLLRVHDQAPANLVWTRTYRGPCDTGNDLFYGVTEAVTGADGGRPGDIIVAGKSSSYCNQGGGAYDALLGHLDGCGLISGFPYGMSVHGGKYDDEFRAVVELTEGIYRGTLAAVGASYGPLNPEAYVVQTRSYPCVRVADLTLGDNSSEKDWGFDITQVTGSHPDAGDLVITGFMTLPNGFNNKDVFIQRLTPGTLASIAPLTHIYGGTQEDEGWSIAPVYDNGPCFTAGYVVAGHTLSFSNPPQLYLIKTDRNLRSGCNEAEVKAVELHPKLAVDCVKPVIGKLAAECRPRTEPVCQDWQERLCYNPDGTQACRAPECPCTGIMPKQNLSGAATGIDAMAIVSAYPNPVRRGADITLECSMAREGAAVLTVSDLSGREIYRASESRAAGGNAFTVSTSGWSTGTYVVTLSAGGRTDSRRVVVTER